MKTFFITSIFIFLFSYLAFAQSTQAVKFQAVVRDGSGELVKNQRVSFEISIVKGSASGTIIYTETHVDTTDAYGLTNLTIGMGTPVTNTFPSIAWGDDEYFIRTSVDITGGTSYTVMGSTQILAVPYSLYSEDANKLDGMNSNAFATHDHVHSDYASSNHSHGLLPVAFGSIIYDGRISRSYNVESCVWNSTYDRYEITIANGFYYSIDDVAMVTISGDSGSCPAGTDARQSSVSGKLLVYLVASDGSEIQCSFRFIAWQGQ